MLPTPPKIFLAAVLSLLAVIPIPAKNHLAKESSPHLRDHADSPVDWPLAPPAFAELWVLAPDE